MKARVARPSGRRHDGRQWPPDPADAGFRLGSRREHVPAGGTCGHPQVVARERRHRRRDGRHERRDLRLHRWSRPALLGPPDVRRLRRPDGAAAGRSRCSSSASRPPPRAGSRPTPGHVAQIEQVILRRDLPRGARRSARCCWCCTPLIWAVLRLDSVVPALLLGRRSGAADDHGRPGRHPPGRAALARAGGWSTWPWACPGWSSAPRFIVWRPDGASARCSASRSALVVPGAGRLVRPAPRPGRRRDQPATTRSGRSCSETAAQLPGAAGVLRALQRRHHRGPQRPRPTTTPACTPAA